MNGLDDFTISFWYNNQRASNDLHFFSVARSSYINNFLVKRNGIHYNREWWYYQAGKKFEDTL